MDNENLDISDKNNRIRYSLLLHALGDTIGYYNAKWEFNYDFLNPEYVFVYELVSDFIDLGGINCIDLKDWRVSDDTILHLAIGDSLIQSKNLKDFVDKVKKNMVDCIDNISKRDAGLNTMKKLNILKNDINAELEFDNFSGGSGAAMRSPIIGLHFDKPDDEAKVVQTALESALVTHNHPTGYLGGIAVALFTNYAINQIDIKEWPVKMLKIIESNKFDTFIKTKYVKHHKYFKDYKHSFIGKWRSYIKDKFNEKGEIDMKIKNLAERGAYYTNNFSFNHPASGGVEFIGSSGDDCLIIAYDSLMDSHDCFEKLVVYSMLHIGDTDTTGCIAGALYGAYYGNKNLPENMEINIKTNLEYRSKIDEIVSIIIDYKSKKSVSDDSESIYNS